MKPVALAAAVPAVTAHHWTDGEIHTAIRKMFPNEWLRGVKLPVLEDLVNKDELVAWRVYAADHGHHKAETAPYLKRGGVAIVSHGAPARCHRV